MNRRSFLARMGWAALCSGMLGFELLDRAPRVETEKESELWYRFTPTDYDQSWNGGALDERWVTDDELSVVTLESGYTIIGDNITAYRMRGVSGWKELRG